MKRILFILSFLLISGSFSFIFAEENSGTSQTSSSSGEGSSTSESTVTDAGVIKVNSAMENVITCLNDVCFENTSILSMQADAYIGKLFPSFPPHLSFGITTSGTLLDSSPFVNGVQVLFDQIDQSLKENDGEVSINFSLPEKFILPSIALRARIGGLFLPFDLGVFFISTLPGTFDSLSITDFNWGMNYTAFGADLRYAILEGNLILPQISLGAGYIYRKQGANFSVKKDISFSGESSSAGSLSTEADLSINSNTLYLQAQISKRLLITTPFAGAKVSLSQNSQDFSWSYTTELNDSVIEDASKKGEKSINQDFDFSNLSTEIFGGLTLNLVMFEFSFCAAWNPVTNYFTGAISTNFRM